MEQILNFFQQFSITTYLIVLTVCILLHRIFFTARYSPPLPPSPGFKLPIIGHLHLLDHDLRKPLRKYRKQLGDVYCLYYGGTLTITIAGYETLKEAFQKHGDLFVDRPPLHLTDKATRKRSFVMSSGQLWKEHRRFVLSTLKDFGMGKNKLETKIHEEIEEFLEELQEHNGSPFDPKEIVNTHIANIICSLVFSGRFKQDDQRFLGIIKMFDENFESAAGAANFVPWMEYIPGDPLKTKKMLSNADKVFEYCEQILAEHVNNFDENDIDDLTSAYIKEMKRAETAGEQTTMNLPMLSGVIADLYMAGSHTTTTAIRWAITCLVQYPEVQEKLHKEITKAIGTDRLPSVQDKTSLGYLEAFTMEVLRFCNLTILSGVHATVRDLEFRGFTIPKHAILMPDMDSVFSDPKIWGDPDIFRPERFLDESGNYQKKDEMIAFFMGKRNCIGESLARMELMLFIGSLVQKFRLDSPKGERLTVEQVDGVFGLAHTPKPYRVVAIMRT